MIKSFMDAFRSNERILEFQGHVFQFLIDDYQNTDGYARCIIWDKTTGERYHSDGYVEIGLITMVTKWKAGYDYTRDNWVHTNELVVEVF